MTPRSSCPGEDPLLSRAQTSGTHYRIFTLREESSLYGKSASVGGDPVLHTAHLVGYRSWLKLYLVAWVIS
jgi:hypothetical protein